MGDQKKTIYILSDQQLRGNLIQNILKSGFEKSFNISRIGSGSIDKISPADQKQIFVIDFIGLNIGAKILINMLKNRNKNAKLIALHLYRSPALIQPLFDMGIDGYVYYEPTRDELNSAVHAVSNDTLYTPSFFDVR
jgi:DNA-binding NarL/FixJ family response regulator